MRSKWGVIDGLILSLKGLDPEAEKDGLPKEKSRRRGPEYIARVLSILLGVFHSSDARNSFFNSITKVYLLKTQ
jgi:hypothetical protein